MLRLAPFSLVDVWLDHPGTMWTKVDHLAVRWDIYHEDREFARVWADPAWGTE